MTLILVYSGAAMETVIPASELNVEVREAAARILRRVGTTTAPRLVATVNREDGRHMIYARKQGAVVRYSKTVFEPVNQCYGDTKCTAPAIAVDMRDKDETESVRVKVCGPHAREAMRLGFRTDALWGVMNVRGLLPDVDTYAAGLATLSRVTWTEIQEAPRDWCDTGCKVYAKRHDEGDGVCIWLRHSRVYGCPVGR
ncbi:hypothetical protein [Actinacidiphila sp. ITFR-21]|uniref:hypothetical protein n=1 Tax=Actinacidiphila sp. ITFR-21 TaxID=3075199 RepID=UPI0028891676|nr:hypothetical protein [Streptomyces sp. ITFR-21]WNI17668.1 hypothetical protein RLT57_20475 [Streptomyces sp. ITFR-21]WNI17808.1 hypothetical protein RLT57_21190 [Streptomyces sp. ITFR-21]